MAGGGRARAAPCAQRGGERVTAVGRRARRGDLPNAAAGAPPPWLPASRGPVAATGNAYQLATTLEPAGPVTLSRMAAQTHLQRMRAHTHSHSQPDTDKRNTCWTSD